MPQHNDHRRISPNHEPGALPVNRLVEVTAEWLPEGTKLDAYWDDTYWNSWVTPLFPLASVHRIVDLMPGVEYHEAEDAVLIHSGNDIEQFPPLSIEVNGQPVTVYVVGAGFCWELAT